MKNKLKLKDPILDSIARHRRKELHRRFCRIAGQAILANRRRKKSAKDIRGKGVR